VARADETPNTRNQNRKEGNKDQRASKPAITHCPVEPAGKSSDHRDGGETREEAGDNQSKTKLAPGTAFESHYYEGEKFRDVT